MNSWIHRLLSLLLLASLAVLPLANDPLESGESPSEIHVPLRLESAPNPVAIIDSGISWTVRSSGLTPKLPFLYETGIQAPALFSLTSLLLPLDEQKLVSSAPTAFFARGPPPRA